ncbi:hypothetical protein PAMP_023017 [Pampus punctatissimus]
MRPQATTPTVSDKPKARGTALSGASGSSSESESSSESDTDESESSSSDSEYNRASRTNTPEPEPPSTNKWQLDSWLNKVQAQTKPLVPPQQEHNSTGSITQGQETFSPGNEAPGVGAAAKTKPCGSNSTPVPAAPTVEHKETRAAFCPGREKAKAKLSQKASGEGQRSKMRLSPGLLSGPEVTTPRRNTTGKKQPRRTERSNSMEDNQSQTWSRANQQSPAAREKDLLPTPSLEHQNPLRPRSKPPSVKTAPRKEPRSATNSNNNTVAPPVALQQTPVPIPSVSVNQDKRKHRGPNSKITPKSREFIETDSSSSSSDCHSDSEEAIKIPALPPQATRSAINTQTLSNTHVHTPLLPCLGSASSLGNLGTFGGKGLRVKDGGSVTTNGSSSSNSSINSGTNGSSSSCNSLSISNITASFGTSVPDPGGLGGQCKDLEPLSPPSNMGHDVPLSPLREYQEIQSLWVKFDLSLLIRVPGQGSQVGMVERDGSEGRERQGDRERVVTAERDRQKQDDREWPGLRERQKLPKVDRQEEENERLAQDRERQGDKDRLTERDREERERFGLGERERTAERREKVCQGLGVLNNPPVQEQNNPRLPGRTERGEIGGKHKRQAAGSMVVPTEKHTSKSKRKHKSDHSEPSVNGNKKLRLDKDCQLLPPCISPIHNHKNSSTDSSLNRKQSRRRDEKLLPPLLSPLSDDPPRKRTCDGGQDGGAAGTLPCSASSTSTSSSSSSHRHRRGESKASSHTRNVSMDKFGKAVNYADGALSFIECGNAMERDPLEAKSPYTMYSETVELIRINGTPSPLSLSPSPASSGGGGGAGGGSGGAPGSSGSVAIPQRIHHMAASHVNITNNILRSYEHWETADRLATDSQEFFQELDSVMAALSQQSSMTELVRYIRQGLHWLRIEAHLL